MNSITINYKSIIFFTFVLLTLALYFIPFSLYDQDGYWMWAPVLSEYLRGNEHYTSSSVIFNGQNLAGIYGELPFWLLFRMLRLSFVEVLNLTHAVFIMLFSLLTFVIMSGPGARRASDFFLAFFLSLFSPIVVNRLCAGHFNLLFGVLPFFVFVALIYKKTFWHLAIYTFALVCALSTQAFQLLSYHIIYLPLILVLVLAEERDRIRYLKLSALISLSAFALSLPATRPMLLHALSSDNLRGLQVNMVYSYLVSLPADFIQLFVSDIYQTTLLRGIGFYHEVSYPVGIFMLFFLFLPLKKGIKYTTVGILCFLVLFSMNTPIGKVFSQLPIIRPFRVPQRAFMIISLFVPILCLKTIKIHACKKELLMYVPFFLASQVFPLMDAVFFVVSGVYFFQRKERNINYAMAFAILGLCSGSTGKVLKVLETDAIFRYTERSFLELKSRYSKNELEKRKFHFQTNHPVLINAVAQASGIATLEGYGHPPKSILEKLERIFGMSYTPGTNTAYIWPPSDDPKKLKEFGADTIVRFQVGNHFEIEELK